MYKLITCISFFIRNFYLPNPFEKLQYGLIINMAIEPLLHLVTFTIVGIFYERGSAPTLGSFLYLFFYIVHVSILILWSSFGLTTVAITVILALYIIAISLLVILKNKIAIGKY